MVPTQNGCNYRPYGSLAKGRFWSTKDVNSRTTTAPKRRAMYQDLLQNGGRAFCTHRCCRKEA